MMNDELMKNAVYLGDIDPNHSILPAMDIRRIIMHQLLIWDKIVLSDSQFLQDPRLSVLLSGYDGDEALRKYGVSDVSDIHKGIECLFENGLIDVAIRKKPDAAPDLTEIWNSMRKSEKKVPYLPEDEAYIQYLDSVLCNTHEYETTHMSNMFQSKLLLGLEIAPEKGGMILQNNDVENTLKRMFSERSPLFRNILDFLREQKKAGRLTLDRYLELYDYVYSCYNVNVSAALGCNVNTKFAHIPFHIQSGEEYFGKNATSEQVERLRPTWALNPIFLDYMTFEEFSELRSHLRTRKVRQFYLNSIESPWAEIEDAWEDYTYTLEQSIKRIMLEKKERVSARIIDEFVDKRYLVHPRQYTISKPLFEITKSVVSMEPITGAIIGGVDTTKNICDAIVALSKRNERIGLAEDFSGLSELVSKETRVVTKYDNSFS